MSDLKYWKAHDDEELTRLTVMGYIRDVEKALPSNVIYKTTEYIIYIILSFLINIFDNNGSYLLKITDHTLIQKMLTAQKGKLFESDDFIMARLKWKLQIIPNYDNNQIIIVRLRLLSSPLIIKQVILGEMLQVKENLASSCGIFEVSQGNFIDMQICPLSELNLYNTLSIQCDINICELILKTWSEFEPIQYPVEEVVELLKTMHTFRYTLDNKKMDSFRNCLNGVAMSSNIYNDMFCLIFYPNGQKSEDIGYLSMYLQLYGFPLNFKTLNVRFTIKCMQNGVTLSSQEEFTVECDCYGKNQWIRLVDLKDLESIDFDVELYLGTSRNQYDDMYNIRDNVQIASILCMEKKFMYC